MGIKALSTNWDSLRKFGQRLEHVVLASLPPEEIRRLRGPALKRSEKPQESPLFNHNETLRIMLGPDLSAEDDTVRLLGQLANLEDVRVFADVESRDRLSIRGLEPWAVESLNGVVVGRWGAADHERQLLLATEPTISLGTALGVMGTDTGSFTGPTILRYSEALSFMTAYSGPMHMMATRIPGALLQRATRHSLATAGIVSPDEALLAALIIRHGRGRHVSTVNDGFISNSESFGWYSGLAQMALPNYLQLISKIASELQANGDTTDQIYDCFEGTFKRVRQLLRIHDQLGFLQLLESAQGTNNSLKDEQGDLVFNAVSNVQSALDGFVVMLHRRACVPLKSSKAINRVSFRNLHDDADNWCKQFGKYQTVADICKEPVAALLDVALNLRRVGFHYYPLMSAALSFNEWMEIVDQAGEKQIRSIREETAGAVRFGEAKWPTTGPTYGIDGMIPTDDELYALPWGFVRALLRETLILFSRLLHQLADVEGVTEQQDQIYFPTASPYARFMLRWDQLALGVPESLGCLPLGSAD
jgi:hypothetical protein